MVSPPSNVLRVPFFVSGADAFVVRLPRCQQMEHDASDLMGRSRYGLWRSKFGAHAAIVLSEGTVAMMQRVRGQTKCFGSTVVDFSSACPQDFASADVIVWTQSKPRGEAEAVRNFDRSGPTSARIV
jgi:hypothetical protein